MPNQSERREWWVLNQTNKFMEPNGTRLELIVFSDKVSPPSLGFLAGYGYVCKPLLFTLVSYGANVTEKKCDCFQSTPYYWVE